MCPGEQKEDQRSSGDYEEGFGSMFNETEQTMVLYQTFDSVEEMKETSDVLLRYMQETIEKITDDVNLQKENIKSIENTMEIQNQKIEGITSTLSEILNILKDDKSRQWGCYSEFSRVSIVRLRLICELITGSSYVM